MCSSDNTGKYSVSVVIPAYNAQDSIVRAINSVLAQRRPAGEIIVIDDGSTDQTAPEVKKFGNSVRYVFQENAGVSAARNHGIRLAKCQWVAFLDSDDEWLDCRLEKQIAIAEENPELMWITGNYICCLCEDERQGPQIDPAKLKQLLEGKDYFENYFSAYCKKASGHTITMLIKREVFDKAGMFDETMSYAEDPDLWWRIAYHFPQVGYVPEPVAIYHMNTPESLSTTARSEQIRILISQLEKHLLLAEKYGQTENFKPLASFLATSWIRGLVFVNQPELIREIIAKFKIYVSFRFRVLAKIAVTFPALTAKLLQMISKCVRATGIRKQISRRPERKA